MSPRKGSLAGDAWPSSVRGLNCSLKWGNERNPRRLLYVSGETAQPKAHLLKQMRIQDLKSMIQEEMQMHSFLNRESLFVNLRTKCASGWEEGEDDARSACPSDTLGYTHNTMTTTTGCDAVRLS